MLSEEAFQRMLDERPEDYATRLVFADWLEERGDPRAAGYRWMGLHCRCPLPPGVNPRDDVHWQWYASYDDRSSRDDVGDHYHLPNRFRVQRFVSEATGVGRWPSRRAAEEALCAMVTFIDSLPPLPPRVYTASEVRYHIAKSGAGKLAEVSLSHEEY